MENKQKKSIDVGSYAIILTLILVVLKLFRLIAISWVWVLFPLWGFIALVALISIGVFGLALIALAVKWWTLRKALKR